MRKPQDKEVESKTAGVGRRDFLTSMGAGAVGAAVLGSDASPPASEVAPVAQRLRVRFLLNGKMQDVSVEPRWTLLYVLREQLGLTGTKVGCERGECGACTVLWDGLPRYACLILAAELEGHGITTIEGLMQDGRLGPVQQAFVEEDGMQCGYCTPGQVMAAEGLLRRNTNPALEEIREGMSGNLCRCGAYDHIFKSVRRAAELRKAEA